jgi:hypothetical protein
MISCFRIDNFVMTMVTTMTLIVVMMVNAKKWGRRTKDELGKIIDG